jgi:hypothetical protein
VSISKLPGSYYDTPTAESLRISISRLWGMKNGWLRTSPSRVYLKGSRFSTLGGDMKEDVTSINR